MLKDQEVEKAGAIESNINKVIASRFKKRGMSWSRQGAFALLKIKETILNGEWDNWWKTQRRQRIKVGRHKPLYPLPILSKYQSPLQSLKPPFRPYKDRIRLNPG